MTLKYVAEIRDPIHGYIKITKKERELIDSIFVQRLRRIHQLARRLPGLSRRRAQQGSSMSSGRCMWPA